MQENPGPLEPSSVALVRKQTDAKEGSRDLVANEKLELQRINNFSHI